MMRKPTGHKEKYSIKSEISKADSNDGTAARTRAFSFDEIMLRRRNKKQSESVEDRVESDRHRHRHRDDVDGSERLDSKESLKVVSRTKEKTVESEYKESHNSYRRSRVDDFSLKDSRRERGVHEKRKNDDRSTDDFDHERGKRHGKDYAVRDGDRGRSEHEKRKNENRSTNDFDHEHGKRHGKDYAVKDGDRGRSEHEKRKNEDRSTDDFDHEHGKRHGKDYAVKEGDRGKSEHEKRKNEDRSIDDFDHEHGKRHEKDYAVKDRDRGKTEHVSMRTQNVYDDNGKKHESRKWLDSTTSEKKQKNSTSESRHEDLKSRSKRSRSRERERDKGKRSKSPSPRGQKQRYYDAREHEDLSSYSSKDGKKVSNNGSDSKSRRHDTSESRLGGYSPRKRRSEAVVKTPVDSRSPEKKNARWDSPSVKMESSLPSLNKTELANRPEVSGVGIPITASIPKPNFGVFSSIPSTMNVTVDSVQLTQATRPKRRIYVENLPPSASEAAVMQWLSGYLRPFGLNHVQGTSPCISCIVNKEKGQALVEFLTPEDASAALNINGKSFSGNIVKIRRPKDYVEASTGVSEKPVAAAVPVKNIVEDSPNKIFIGGISKVITSEMLMEIASAFGPLKAYHFEDNAYLNSRCAFVEYADQSVTIKACVGLNGMKLGGQVLTVTQAISEASGVHDNGPFYGTPVHARPLLEKPTQVLKLNNVLDPHSLPSLSESELEEILEDIRLECARFGMVKSINIIKQTTMPTSSETGQVNKEANSVADDVTKEANSMADEVIKEADSMADEVNKEVNTMADEATKEAKSMADEVTKEVTEPSCSVEPRQHEEPAGENNTHNETGNVNRDGGIVGDKHEEACDTTMVDHVVENTNTENNLKPTDDIETEPKPLKVGSHDAMKNISDLIDTFEMGCVLVEYKRTEASSMAAHCLHGRVFDGRSVSVEYVAYDDYCTRFHK